MRLPALAAAMGGLFLWGAPPAQACHKFAYWGFPWPQRCGPEFKPAPIQKRIYLGPPPIPEARPIDIPIPDMAFTECPAADDDTAGRVMLRAALEGTQHER
jgi:hypothetical protein